MNYLEKIDVARQALIEAKTVCQTKTILDKAEAVAAFTKQQNMSREIQDYANEFVLDAQIKLGGLIKEMPKNQGGGDGSNQHKRATGSNLVPVAKTPPPTYAELGIDKKDAAQWQYMAKHEAEIAEKVNTRLTNNQPITVADIVREVKGGVNYRSNNTGENEWYTPPEYIGLVREVIGDIDLDPASCEEANKTIRAATFYTEADNGLTKEWKGRVFVNPPYSRNLMSAFIAKLKASYVAGEIEAAILVSHNNTDTLWFQSLAATATAICFPCRRIKFYRGDNVAAPINGQAFFYLGSDKQKFIEVFKKIGVVMGPL